MNEEQAAARSGGDEAPGVIWGMKKPSRPEKCERRAAEVKTRRGKKKARLDV